MEMNFDSWVANTGEFGKTFLALGAILLVVFFTFVAGKNEDGLKTAFYSNVYSPRKWFLILGTCLFALGLLLCAIGAVLK